MRQIEPDPAAVNRLMMGPDGAVHIIPTGTRKASPSPEEMEGLAAAKQQASTSGRADLPANAAKRDTGLPDVRQAPGDGSICFSYSAGIPVADREVARQVLRGVRRMPTGSICFSYSVGMPPSGGDDARRALREVRRMPTGGICFSYSAATPPGDRDARRRALRDIRRAPAVGVCFSH
jgi:hypothetical protein